MNVWILTSIWMLLDFAKCDEFIDHCRILDQRYNTGNFSEKHVAQYGKERNITINWSSDAGLIPAVVLATVLRYGLRYINVNVKHCNQDLCASVEYYPCHNSWEFSERLLAVGPGAVTNSPRLHVRLAGSISKDPECLKARTWTFYTNHSLLQRCQFSSEVPNVSGLITEPEQAFCKNNTCYPVFIPRRQILYAESLLSIVKSKSLPLFKAIFERVESPERRLSVFPGFSNNYSSYLFIDYDIWDGYDNVLPVEFNVNSHCWNTGLPDELSHKQSGCFSPSLSDTTRSLKVVDWRTMRQFTPYILRIVREFKLSTSDLQNIINESQELSVEQAACKWARTHKNKFESWLRLPKPEFYIHLSTCIGDPNALNYYKLAKKVIAETNKEIQHILFQVKQLVINCSDVNELRGVMDDEADQFSEQTLAGFVAGGEGSAAAANLSSGIETELILYDTPSSDTKLGPAAYSVTGSLHDLALSYHQLFTNYDWKKIAIFSDLTLVSKSFHEHVKNKYDIVFRNYKVDMFNVNDVLKQAFAANAKVFIVNTNSELAANILCAARDVEMTLSLGYVWVVREWNSVVPMVCELGGFQHFTLSYSWRGGDDFVLLNNSIGSEKLRNLINGVWPNKTWPLFAAPITDAIVFLMNGFNSQVAGNNQWLSDPHGHNSTKYFSKFVKNLTMKGVSNDVLFKNFTRKNPYIFFEEWQGNSHELLSVWKVSNERNINSLITLRTPFGVVIPLDYRSNCIFKSKDDFAPICFDIIFAVCILFVLSTPVALYIAWKIRKRLFARRELKLKEYLLDQHEQPAGLLAVHLIDQKHVQNKEKLGSGYFGEVELCILRLPNELPQRVACKILHKHATRFDERNFIREAQLMTTLKHDHVVKFVGVSFSCGQLYLLMEYAFHGDMRSYLRGIRLLSIKEKDEECEISAMNLTRLAREAASALGYLEERRVVHRDVRACNCLLTAELSLKLADFGMAINVDENSETHNSSVIPIMSMAPETLSHKKFSFKSDIWSLGILMIEIITLGKSPYGKMTAFEVIQHIRKGGLPFVPAANTEFCTIVQQCCKRLPEERPTAKKVEEFLLTNPTAVDPSCPSTPSTPSLETDSGFSET